MIHFGGKQDKVAQPQCDVNRPCMASSTCVILQYLNLVYYFYKFNQNSIDEFAFSDYWMMVEFSI